jgi:hypothetical protein
MPKIIETLKSSLMCTSEFLKALAHNSKNSRVYFILSFWNPHIPLVGIYISKTTMENRIEALQKTKNRTAI